jgi:hypothetical protein
VAKSNDLSWTSSVLSKIPEKQDMVVPDAPEFEGLDVDDDETNDALLREIENLRLPGSLPPLFSNLLV